ncbi:hypothetical protein ABZ488_02100 [Streptomyces griseus]|uniref:hypothetical protein n=1 Tax=Streptomyces griseus TaxID=1911 RepID=UPI0033D485DF
MPSSPTDGAPESRKIPWVHVGTALTVVAAIGGLIFTGVTTYYGTKTSSDQLQQSREEDEKEGRAQAEQISFHMSGGNSSEDVHIVNRSSRPIHDPRAIFWIEFMGVDEKLERTYYTTGWAGDLDACQELVFSSADFDPAPPPMRRHVRQGDPQILLLNFTDQDGKKWNRTPDSLKPQPQDSGMPAPPDGPTGNVTAAPKTEEVKACGDKAS